MNTLGLLQQPLEVLTRQLMQLDPLDLLNACSATSGLAELCNDPYIWRQLIKRDIPITFDVDEIQNPKEYYLSAMIFTGEVYYNGKLINNTPLNYLDVFLKAT